MGILKCELQSSMNNSCLRILAQICKHKAFKWLSWWVSWGYLPELSFWSSLPRPPCPVWAGSGLMVGTRKAGVQLGYGSAGAWSPSWDSTSGSSQEASVKSIDLFFFFFFFHLTSLHFANLTDKMTAMSPTLGSWYTWQCRCGTWTVDAWCGGGRRSPLLHWCYL